MASIEAEGQYHSIRQEAEAHEDLSLFPRVVDETEGHTCKNTPERKERKRVVLDGDERRDASGARRPIGRAGPGGELDAPQLPLLGFHLAPTGAVPSRAAARSH